MKTLTAICSLALAAALCGCNSEDAAVTRYAPGGSVSKGSSVGGVAVTRNEQDGSRFGTMETTLVFSLLANDLRGAPANRAGLAFLQPEAAGTRPFTYHFAPTAPGHATRLFVTTSRGVLFATRTGPTESTLSLFDPATRKAAEVARVPQQQLTSLSASDNLALIGWTNSAGRAFVLRSGAAAPLRVGSADVAYGDIQTSNDTLTVVALGQDPKTGPVFSIVALDGEQPAAPTTVAGSAARLSPDGTRIAFASGEAGRAGLMVYDRARGDAQAAPLADGTTSIGDLAWKSGSVLTYRASFSDGSARLINLDLDTGQSTLVASLELPATAEEGSLVCPAWLDDTTVYFADLRGGGYSVSRARLIRGVWKVEAFARAPGDGYSITCPQILFGRSS